MRKNFALSKDKALRQVNKLGVIDDLRGLFSARDAFDFFANQFFDHYRQVFAEPLADGRPHDVGDERFYFLLFFRQHRVGHFLGNRMRCWQQRPGSDRR